MASSLWLMTAYVVVAFALQAVAMVACMTLDSLLGTWGTPVFVTVYFLMFWLAWPIALRITAPTAASSQS
jgi:hypothetical protein